MYCVPRTRVSWCTCTPEYSARIRLHNCRRDGTACTDDSMRSSLCCLVEESFRKVVVCMSIDIKGPVLGGKKIPSPAVAASAAC